MGHSAIRNTSTMLYAATPYGVGWLWKHCLFFYIRNRRTCLVLIDIRNSPCLPPVSPRGRFRVSLTPSGYKPANSNRNAVYSQQTTPSTLFKRKDMKCSVRVYQLVMMLWPRTSHLEMTPNSAVIQQSLSRRMGMRLWP